MLFKLENPRTLKVNLNGVVWVKTGSIAACVGNIRFERERLLEWGVGRMVKKAVTGKGVGLTKAHGQGCLYLADGGKCIRILKLQNGSISVQASNLLAFEPAIDWDIRLMKKLSAVMAGELFNLRLSGTGMIAVTTHLEAVSLGAPAVAAPSVLAAWTGALRSEIYSDASMSACLRRGDGPADETLEDF